MQCHSLAEVGHGKRRDEFDCLSLENVQCHSLAVHHGKRCDAFYEMCNITHLLLVIGIEDVMKLPFTESAMSLTPCWSCNKTAFTKCAMSLTSFWSWK